MARKKISRVRPINDNGFIIFKESKMFQVFPVEDKGVTVDKQNVGSYIFAELGPNQALHAGERNSPFIAEITGRDPTYRYARRFVGRSTMSGRRVNYLVRHVPKPILLDIRAQERGYYLLRIDGEPSEITNSNILQPLKLERIERDTVDDLLEADRLGKLPNPFAKKTVVDLLDTPEIREALKDYGHVAAAYNRAMLRLEAMPNISPQERSEASAALIAWYHRMQQAKNEPFGNPIADAADSVAAVAYSKELLEQAIKGTALATFPGVSGDSVLKGHQQSIFDQSWDYDEDEIEQVMLPAQFPPARKPKKPKDFEKRGYIPPLAPAPGKRRINLKDLK